MTPSRDIGRLLEIMAALRTPKTGCPWDLEQNFATIAPYTLEEAYEVADAIARDDLADLEEELGDLLLQVVFHARMARRARRLRFRRRGRGDHRQAHPPASACVRRRKGEGPQGGQRIVGTDQGAGERPAPRPAGRAERRAGRRAGRPARADPRAEAASQGQPGRLRLERSARGLAQNPRRGRRDRGGAR